MSSRCKETEKPKKRLNTPKTAKPKEPENTQEPKVEKGGIVTPVRMETRRPSAHRNAEAYLMDSGTKHRYVCSQSEVASPKYLDNVDALMGIINEGKILSRTEAREWLVEAAKH